MGTSFTRVNTLLLSHKFSFIVNTLSHLCLTRSMPVKWNSAEASELSVYSKFQIYVVVNKTAPSERILLGTVCLLCDGTGAETRFRLSAKWTSPFKAAGAAVQSTTGSRAVGISCINAGYTMFRGSVESTGYPLHSPVSPSLPLPCGTVWHHISTGQR
jgi:hypothetical protein